MRGDEVIELAMVRFAYSPEGEVLSVVDTFQGYHEPTKAISAEITALTGISAETVAGHRLDADAVGAFVAPAVIVLVHNAGFDRRFAERLHPWFSTKAWGCNMGEPPAKVVQILVFTHHHHLIEVARCTLGDDAFRLHALTPVGLEAAA